MMLDFERGDSANPGGHALVYFRAYDDESKIYATYLIVPPINIELAKYMPPMFASKISMTDVENVSSIPLPPIPEQVESLDLIMALAESRNDDLIYGGIVDTSDVEKMLFSISEAAQAYLELYNSRPSISVIVEEQLAEGKAAEVSDVLYTVMSDKDKLSELTRLTGSLRYAIEGSDQAMAEEVQKEMETLATFLGEKYKVMELIKAAQTPGLVASKLSALYTDRCYKLCEEDYRAVAELEKQIESLKKR